MTNARVDAWLRTLGYSPEPEPDWVPGQKPDFFCPGEAPLWVEVKTFEESPHQRRQAWAWEDFRARVARIQGAKGEVFATVSSSYTEADGKLAAQLLRRIARSPPPSSSNVTETIVLPPDPVADTMVTIRYVRLRGPVVQIGPRPESGHYGYYPGYDPEDWGQEVEIACAGQQPVMRQGYDVFEGDTNGPVALIYARSERPLRLVTLMSAGGSTTTARRVREAIDEANDQFRSGQSCVPAPGICVIYHESLEATSGHMFLAALFGDLTVPIGLDPIQPGDPFLGRNGILAPAKNRGVSAVRYVTSGTVDAIALNPYAEYPVEAAMFRAPVWVAEGTSMTIRHTTGG